jgi:hypothetical protein
VLLATCCLAGCAAKPEVRAPLAAATATPPDRDGDGILDAEDKMPSSPPSNKPTKTRVGLAPDNNAGEGSAHAANEKHDSQLIVYSARVTMGVYQVEQGLAAVENLARNMGGYLAQKHDREITVRVPRARFQPTLVAIDKLGDVVHRDIQAEDVSDDYVDTEIRITNARAMQVRLRQLLERAPVKEALDIEKELARITQELELLEGKMKVLKDRIAYSTITVAFEPRSASIQSRTRLPFPWLAQIGLPTLLNLQEAK